MGDRNLEEKAFPRWRGHLGLSLQRLDSEEDRGQTAVLGSGRRKPGWRWEKSGQGVEPTYKEFHSRIRAETQMVARGVWSPRREHF